MRDDELLKERLRRAADVPAPPWRLPAVAGRARVLRWRRAGAVAAVAAMVAAAIAVPLSRLSWLRHDGRDVGSTLGHVGAIGFDPVEGWNMAASDPSSPEWSPTVWVTNAPFADVDVRDGHVEDGILRLAIGPEATTDRLPNGGILISAQIVYASRNPLPSSDTFSPAVLPLHLPDTPPETSWEGSIPGQSLHQIVATVNGRWVTVGIRYGSEHPDAAMLAEAQRELDRLFVDPAPPPIGDVDQFGIRMTVPDGWYARLFAWTSGPPTLELSTVPLDRLSGDSAVPNRDRLDTLDASIVLAEDDTLDPGFPRIELPIAIRAEDRCDGCEVLDDGSTPPDGHALYRRVFEAGGRSFELYVEFGTPAPPEYLWHAVNDVLGAIEIAGAVGVEAPAEPLLVAPEGWFVQEDPLPALIDPRILVAVGSWDFPRPALVACGVQPGLRAMPRDGAFFWIVEYPLPTSPGEVRPKGGVPWPSTFSLDLPSRPSDSECAAGAIGSVRDYRFEAPDRFIQVQVGLGPDATARTRRAVEGALSSFFR